MSSVPRRPRVLLAVTAAQSLKLMDGLPEHLMSNGWDVDVVVGECPASHNLAVPLHVVPMTRTPSPLSDLLALSRWLLLLQRLKPDVVLAGTPKAGLLGMVASRLMRVPVRIYMLRGLRLETERGAMRQLLRGMEKLSSLCATRVLCVSRSLQAEYVRHGLARSSKTLVLGEGSSNGVAAPPLDEPSVERSVLGLDEDVPVLGFVGRICADKGVGVLADALRMLDASGTPFQALLIGAEEPEGALAVSGLTEFGPRVRWVGSVSDPGPYYTAMDVLCLPSLREGFPNVVLEAAVRGVPAIVSDATGTIDSVVHCETGMIVGAGSPRSLADGLRQILSNSEQRRALGTAARLRAETVFARPVVHRQIEAFAQREYAGTHRRRPLPGRPTGRTSADA